MQFVLTNIFANPWARKWSVDAAGAAVALALLLLFYRGAYAPWGRDIDDRLQRMQQLQALVATADQVAEDHRNLVQRLGALRHTAQQVRTRMPPLTSGNDFVHEATQLAKSMGLEVTQCAAGVPQITPTHSTVEVTCRMSGSYASICEFFAAIDQLPQIAMVSSLDVETAEYSDAYPFQATFQLYYRADLHDKQKRGAP